MVAKTPRTASAAQDVTHPFNCHHDHYHLIITIIIIIETAAGSVPVVSKALSMVIGIKLIWVSPAALPSTCCVTQHRPWPSLGIRVSPRKWRSEVGLLCVQSWSGQRPVQLKVRYGGERNTWMESRVIGEETASGEPSRFSRGHLWSLS